MSKTVEIHLVDAFTKTIGKGNRAGVVFDADDLTEEQMQEIAAFANVSETAFVIGSKNPNEYDVQVRYFTPTKEVPLCGHATIATHYLRAAHEGINEGTIRAKTGVGILPVDIISLENDRKIIMTQGKPTLEHILSNKQQGTLKSALGISDADLVEGLPLQVSSTGHSKIMIPVKHEDIVHRINPDQEKLKQLSEEIGSDGFYIFSVEDDTKPYKTHGRMFAPAIGIAEDPVTGNANGPAGLYLAQYGQLDFKEHATYYAVQGEAMGKPGVVEVILEKENNAVSKVQVAGSAVIAETITYDL